MIGSHMLALFLVVVNCFLFLGSSYNFISTLSRARWGHALLGSKPLSIEQCSAKRFSYQIKSSVNPIVDPLVNGMPSQSKFSEFYQKVVKPGAEMRLDQFMIYPEVAELLEDGLIYSEDLNSLWISAVGDATGLNVEEGYEMLCMVLDMPDPEDVEFLDREFKQLTGGKDSLPFFKFLAWGDVQDIMNSNILSMEEISQLWRQQAGDLNASLDRKAFGKLNNALDDAIEEKEEVDEKKSKAESLDAPASAPVSVAPASESGGDDANSVDVWSNDFDPKSVFDDKSLEEIATFFKASSKKGKIDKASFMAWQDIKDMLAEGVISEEKLNQAWVEATAGFPTRKISYDKFLRLNVKVDLLLDIIEDSEESSNAASTPSISQSLDTQEDGEVDAEKFYRTEFRKAASNGSVMSLESLLSWSEIQELINDGAITVQQVTKMFDGMPKTEGGITEDTFVAFNGMMDVVLDASQPSGDVTAKSTGSAPKELVSEPARPMPAVSELKIGSLGSASDDNADSGLSTEELELMSVLDKADNMLNSGSFSDFDRLIGDVNDPRLQALREKREGAEEIEGQLKDILSALTALCKEQTKCGLDSPDDEMAARLRDLTQAVIEKAPKAASRDINDLRKAVSGDWKLLYTNSEMFKFYNGITGFANVFPTAKFLDLATQYTSDGYLSEAKFFENFSTSLGPGIAATVFANWEIVKEMSFMTNENSVVMRTYCNKVTAGPMVYEAQENWKSLRTMSMNELVYVDDNIKIMRNVGALRIFFVYQRI